MKAGKSLRPTSRSVSHRSLVTLWRRNASVPVTDRLDSTRDSTPRDSHVLASGEGGERGVRNSHALAGGG